MNGTTMTRSHSYGPITPVRYEFDTEADPASGAEAVAEEVGLDEATSGGAETGGIEAADPTDHEVMSNDGVSGDAGGDGEGAADSESAAEAADTETDFETDTEWAPDDRFQHPTESAGDEATLDAYFAEAADNPEDAREFLPIFAALVPVVKAAIPFLVSTLAQRGVAAAAGAATKTVGKAVASAPGLPPQLAQQLQQLLRQPMISPQLRTLLTGMLSRRESSDETTEGGDIEALLQSLSTTEVVIGVDDRRRVTTTTTPPWNRICHLRIRARNGQIFLGTGFFVGKRTVVTAGHCVYQGSQGGWPTEIQVTQGRNELQQPYGSIRASSLRTVKGWALRRRRECDYGAIILPRSYVQKAPSFGFAAYSDTEIKGRKLNIAGYPGDKPPGTMWYHGRLAMAVSERVITYDIDTAGGQSGSPVWQRRDNRRIVVGIHTNGAHSGNSATRIVRPVYDNLTKWRTEGE